MVGNTTNTAPAQLADATVLDAIETEMDRTAAGWNSGDMALFLSVYSPSRQTSFVTDKGLLRGVPAMEAMYRQAYDFDDAAKRGTLSFERLDFRPLGPSHALYIARYTVAVPGAQPVSGVTSLVWERYAEGWRIIADHSG
ncbi:hypothetical protein PK98_10045 [Croceibacterium mercuriale]|uniref:DUF4440 domain-containing protein n=1 Tax=Croceibacterium mercuriale TaxID=1572751 RepID=A0A0B2BUC9_9SPHN|nr:hypothetical protein PK98_10045 [Croceibacterium mercuriale]